MVMSKNKKKSGISGKIWGLVFITSGIFLFLALASYHPNDVSYYLSPPNTPCINLMGTIGSWTAFSLYFLFGITSYLISIAIMFRGASIISGFRLGKRIDIYIFAWCLAVISLCGLLALIEKLGFSPHIIRQWKLTGMGGLTGLVFEEHFLLKYLGYTGSALVMALISTISLLYITEMHFWLAIKWIFNILWEAAKWMFYIGSLGLLRFIKMIKKHAINNKRLKTKIKIYSEPKKLEPLQTAKKEQHISPSPAPAIEKSGKPLHIKNIPAENFGSYKIPPVDILMPAPAAGKGIDKENLSQNSKILEAAFKEFGINVQVSNIQHGPVVTLYEIVLAPGTKIGKITSLTNDIAMAMRVGSVRIIAPIPGKSAVGIEVPNTNPRFVYLKEVINTNEFQRSNAGIPLALGMDISGVPLVTDLTEMPHLLIAGTTGSGKTICLNTIILSILLKHRPDEVKLLLIDPKMVELSAFKNLPHLLIPVIHQPKKVSLALNWVVREMEHRYALFAEEGIRNIQGYNNRPIKENSEDIPVENPKGLLESDYENYHPAKLPYIVIIIDELADLMMVSAADIEIAIARLAQLSRAVGIHIILATQRPSVDVLTGVIKANFSTRISFQVASGVDSRTVLGTGGADMLLGKGDLLFMPPGTSKLIRAQGTLVRDLEISRVVKFILSQQKAEFSTKDANEKVFHKIQETQKAEAEQDPLFQKAVNIILATQQPSVSILQRKLRIGYNRAARIVDLMEERGIVGPLEDGKRKILADSNSL